MVLYLMTYECKFTHPMPSARELKPATRPRGRRSRSIHDEHSMCARYTWSTVSVEGHGREEGTKYVCIVLRKRSEAKIQQYRTQNTYRSGTRIRATRRRSCSPHDEMGLEVEIRAIARGLRLEMRPGEARHRPSKQPGSIRLNSLTFPVYRSR